MREHPLMHTLLHAYQAKDSNLDVDVDLALRTFDDKETWPSPLATGGRVGWTRFTTGKDGWVEIDFDQIK
jgi:hypothetical protein